MLVDDYNAREKSIQLIGNTEQQSHYPTGNHHMLATSKNILFPGHNHQLTTGTADPTLAGAQAIIKVLGHQHQQLPGGYILEIGHFRSD